MHTATGLQFAYKQVVIMNNGIIVLFVRVITGLLDSSGPIGNDCALNAFQLT